MQATPSSSPVVPPEVYVLAAEQGVTAYLPAVLELTQRVFPNAPLSVYVSEDPELANVRSIVFDVAVPADIPQALADHRRWNDGVFACCPAPLVCTFVLSMDLIEG